MDNQSYTYKCPSCGSAIGFDNEKNVWKCEYCKNEYNNLFLTPTEELEDVEDYSSYYYYYCDKCNTSFYSKSLVHSCYRCENKITGKKEKIGGTISTNYSEKTAAGVLLNELTKYREFLPQEYLTNIQIDHKYIMCDLYSGSVILSNGTEETKYFFVNTMIPRIDTDNYRILYDFANAGFNSIDNYVIDPKYNYVVEKSSHDIEVKYDDVKKKIIDSCIYTFKRMHNTPGEITVKEDLDVKKSLLIRTYYSSFTVDGEEHRCYIFGYNKQTYFNKYNRFSLDFPRIKDRSNDELLAEIDDLRRKANMITSLGAMCVSMLVIAFMFFLFVLIVAQTSAVLVIFALLTPVLCTALIVAVIFMFIKKAKLSKQIAFLKISIRANENDFYYNLVNNSNFVKKVGR